MIGTLEKAISDGFQEPTLYPKHLPVDIRVRLKKTELTKENTKENNIPNAVDQQAPHSLKFLPALKDYREDAISKTEKQNLESLIKQTEGNIKEACRISGLSRPRLYALLKKFNMTKQTF